MQEDQTVKEAIKESPGDTIRDETQQKFLIFQIEDKKYAFPAELVREIIITKEIFFLPFVPPYVRGIINRHGEPYTVFDLQVIFENEILDGEKFLILNLGNDQIAFIITDIVEIKAVPHDEIKNIHATDEDSIYFMGFFQVMDNDVLIINLEAVLERLESDL